MGKSDLGFGAILLVAILCPRDGAGLYWSSMRVHWDISLKPDGGNFEPMPLTKDAAEKESWRILNVKDCLNDGKFNGFRYFKGEDLGFNLLFDANGYVAGTQMNLLKKELNGTPNTFRYDKVPAYVSDTIKGQGVYTLTVYFTDPEIICSGGRSAFSVWRYGMGTKLYIQTGPTPDFYYVPPTKRDKSVAENWSRSPCVPGMGFHGYYGTDIYQVTNCDYNFPYALNYESDHDGELRGFAFNAIGHCTSPRYEHSDVRGVYYIHGKNAAQCLVDVPSKATFCQLHVFLMEKPWEYTCPTDAPQ